MDDKVEKALALHNIGDRKLAREILVALIKENPNNEDAWLGLALCTNEINRKKFYLNRVLEINPSNTRAKKLLLSISGSRKNYLLVFVIIVLFLLVIALISGVVFLYYNYFLQDWTAFPLLPTLPDRRAATPILVENNNFFPTNVDVRELVLRPNEVGYGFVLNVDESGYWSNEDVSKDKPDPFEYREKLVEWGRINGYRVLYENHQQLKAIENIAILMRNGEGAKQYLEFLHHRDILDGWKDIDHEPIGDESLIKKRNISSNMVIYQVASRMSNLIIIIKLYGPEHVLSIEEAFLLSKQLLQNLSAGRTLENLSVLPSKKGGTSLPGFVIGKTNVTSVPLLPPTQTFEPTSTPHTINQTQSLGPIWNSIRDETYWVEITVHNVTFSKGDNIYKPKTGYIFMYVNVTIRNIGSSPMRSVSDLDFQVRDPNGALLGPAFGVSREDCSFDLVDLLPGGSISGCIAFEVPLNGTLELIYAPYQYYSLEQGRYLRFVLR